MKKPSEGNTYHVVATGRRQLSLTGVPGDEGNAVYMYTQSRSAAANFAMMACALRRVRQLIVIVNPSHEVSQP
ncbi:hypothetical protein PTKU46_83940 [Paraburkholderia terrae]|uniref:hypothetical protein n=1 Tax=Paraburkholderia terrae TaxID=311230 RepID=UPI0030E1DC00